jgi:hypothetical protein
MPNIMGPRGLSASLVPRQAAGLAVVVALAVGALGIWKGSFVAGDGDAFGYVSEANLIAHGTLRIEQQFVRTLPWPFADWSFAPAGYRPATVRGFIVPTYPAGVPLVMALFQRLAGARAVFYVVPLLGALCVWMTSALGASVHGRLTGTLAAVLVATSPSFLFELMAPASDVAATAWWTSTLALAVRDSQPAALGAGVAASLAILTRPNLVPLAAVVGLFFVSRIFRGNGDRRRTMIQLALFVLAALPGCLAVAAINDHLYGSPLRSGYESLDALYALVNVGPNLDRYPRWLMQTQTPFLCLALAAPVFGRTSSPPRETPPLAPNQVALLLSFVAVVFLSYLFYRPFGREEWTYLRFLLPAYPALLILAVAVTIEASRRVIGRHGAATVAAVTVCLALSGWQAHDAVRRGALTARLVEGRYVDVGRYIDAMLPPNSVFIAKLHAGSIRYYSGRLTLYYEWLEHRWLDDAVRELSARGYHPFIVLEDSEETPFRERFGALNKLGLLDWPPMAERSEPALVRIYDPVDQERFQHGETIETRSIEHGRRW